MLDPFAFIGIEGIINQIDFKSDSDQLVLSDVNF